MSIRWRSAFRYPQTTFLLVGAGLGFLALVVFTGFQWVGVVVGAIIAVGMLGAWFFQFRGDRLNTTGNLLDRTVMLEHLDAISAKFPGIDMQSPWVNAYQWSSESQTAAAEIAERDSTLIPDLLEALYTVEGLAANIAGSTVALEQVQTEQYRTLTQQQLEKSCDRLQETHHQLQALRDQIVLAQLSADANASVALPDRLQLLIEANKTTLQTAADDPT
ncbi:hypothetical protein [Leptolyngbya iicbica]|uniref:Uncharacterized protein n=2 Tax=Cyanophyceae TaxID=3028117 RepID=A0A4Q7E8D6_9CYAN|nr:hypothetical protein [Leptolyngbya sp. LK]RZM78808.1 hypothetical protein DYY88_08425 [Leptolyngbya sp. LK]